MVTLSSHASTGSSEESFLTLRFPLRLDTSAFHMTRSSEHRSRSNCRSTENYWQIPTRAKRRSHVPWGYCVTPLSCACTMRNNEEFILICQPPETYYVFLVRREPLANCSFSCQKKKTFNDLSRYGEGGSSISTIRSP